MSSPFPGMDPYLEGSHWMGIHTQLSAEIARQLTPRLVPKYVALTNERFVLETSDDIGIATPDAVPHVSVEIRDAAQRQLVTAMKPATSSVTAAIIQKPIAKNEKNRAL